MANRLQKVAGRVHSFTADEARQEHDELVCRPWTAGT